MDKILCMYMSKWHLSFVYSAFLLIYTFAFAWKFELSWNLRCPCFVVCTWVSILWMHWHGWECWMCLICCVQHAVVHTGGLHSLFLSHLNIQTLCFSLLLIVLYVSISLFRQWLFSIESYHSCKQRKKESKKGKYMKEKNASSGRHVVLRLPVPLKVSSYLITCLNLLSSVCFGCEGLHGYLNLGIKPEQLVLGVPWYGYDYPCLSLSQVRVWLCCAAYFLIFFRSSLIFDR